MDQILKTKLLSIPLFVWGLQVLYVAAALALLFLIVRLYPRLNNVSFQVIYVAIMIVIDIAWRLAIRKWY